MKKEPFKVPVKSMKGFNVAPSAGNEFVKHDALKTLVNPANIKDECEEIAKILIKKNHDYGNSVEEQFNEYGLASILIRLDDKLKRLKNLQKNNSLVADESIIDTLEDLAGYAILGTLCLMGEGKTK